MNWYNVRTISFSFLSRQDKNQLNKDMKNQKLITLAGITVFLFSSFFAFGAGSEAQADSPVFGTIHDMRTVKFGKSFAEELTVKNIQLADNDGNEGDDDDEGGNWNNNDGGNWNNNDNCTQQQDVNCNDQNNPRYNQ